MKTIVYSTEYNEIATIEDGYIWSYSNDVLIGRFDKEDTFPKNVFLKNVFMGYTDEYEGYSDYNKVYFHVKDNTIYDSNNNIIAYFKGNPHEAIAGSIVCLALKLTTPTPNLQTKSETEVKENFSPTIFLGGIITNLPMTILSILITVGLAMFIGIYIAEWFWNTFIKDANFFSLLCYTLPLILVHIIVPIKIYSNLIHTDSSIIFSVMKKLFLYTLMCAGIAELITIITIYSTAMDEIYIFLSLLATVPMYVLISLPFSLLASLIVSLVIKCK